MENASRRYTSEEIKHKIERQKRRYDWEFIFLGANIDAVETARHYGIDEDRAVNYVPDGEGTELNYRVMSEAVAEYRVHGTISSEHLATIRKDMKKRG
jgi:hypothetical protein